MTRPQPNHCCHAPTEPCAYGWTDTHMHRCTPTTAETNEEH